MPGTLNMPVVPQIRDCGEAPLIEMRSIVKTFKNAAGEFTALRGVTACFYEGEFVSIVGKSGSGKSTLANMITGIDHPTSGQVLIRGVDIHKMNESDMSLWRGRNLGIVFQFFQLMPTLTLLENVILPMYLTGYLDAAGREKRARELLALVGLAGFEDKLPAAVSGGQQQCAAIARALANDPPILIADEPTGNLDSRTADDVFAIFSGLMEAGKTILMVTHDAGLARRTSRTLLLSDGELINPWVAACFPELPHSQMLWLSHHLQERSLDEPRRLDGSTCGLWLFTGGTVQAHLNGTSQARPVTLQPGHFLSALELQAAGAQLILSPNGDGPASALHLDGDAFRKWLQEAPDARRTLQQAARRQYGGEQAGILQRGDQP